MVLLWRWPVSRMENVVTEAAFLMEVEWSCYGGGQFKGGRIIVTEVASLKQGRMVMLQR